MIGSAQDDPAPKGYLPLHAVHERANLAPFRRRPEFFQLTSAKSAAPLVGLGEAPLDSRGCRRTKQFKRSSNRKYEASGRYPHY